MLVSSGTTMIPGSGSEKTARRSLRMRVRHALEGLSSRAHESGSHVAAAEGPNAANSPPVAPDDSVELIFVKRLIHMLARNGGRECNHVNASVTIGASVGWSQKSNLSGTTNVAVSLVVAGKGTRRQILRVG